MPYKDKQVMYANQIKRWIRRKKQAIEYLGGQCKKCGYNTYYGALTFHHKDPTTKRWTWDKLRLRKWEDIYSELERCELLCMNCHMETHGKGTF